MNKKVISAILAGACAVSAMGLSVSAATVATGNKAMTAMGQVTLSAAGTMVVPTINVSVPASIGAVINPYGVGVTSGGVEYGAEGVQSVLYNVISQTTSSAILVKAKPTVTVPVAAINGSKTYTAPTIAVIESVDGLEDDAVKDNKTKEKYNVAGNFTIVKVADDPNTDSPFLTADVTTRKAMYVAVVANGSVAAKIVTQEMVDDTTDVNKDGTLKAEDVNATAVKDKAGNVTGYTIDLNALPKDKFDPASEDAIEVAFANATAYKLNGVDVKPATATAHDLIFLDKAAEDGFTYAQFKVLGDVTKNSADAGWTTADKVTFSVVLDIQIVPDDYEMED